jgi:hypothetical protein
VLSIVLVAGALDGCVEHGSEVLARASGVTCFSKALSREYLQLSYALETHGRRGQAAAFRDRAASVSIGKNLTPAISEWGPEHPLPGDIQDALKAFNVLKPLALNTDPFAVAHAQGRLDCWGELAVREKLESEASRCKADFTITECYLAYRDDQNYPHSAGEEACKSTFGVNGAPVIPTPNNEPLPWEC